MKAYQITYPIQTVPEKCSSAAAPTVIQECWDELLSRFDDMNANHRSASSQYMYDEFTRNYGTIFTTFGIYKLQVQKYNTTRCQLLHTYTSHEIWSSWG